MARALDSGADSDFSDEELTPLDVSFNKATGHVRSLTAKLSNDQLLQLYALYKQGTIGKCDTPKPGWFDASGRKKWTAWDALNDMPAEEAKQKYVDLVLEYDPNWTELDNAPKVNWVTISSLWHDEPELKHDELSLIDAARENLPETVKMILYNNPEEKDMKDENGLTALHWAADRDATAALEACLSGGCDINAVDNNNQTPLHYAASCGHAKSTQILLDCGALLLKDDEDCTPLDVASDDEIKRLLQSHQK